MRRVCPVCGTAYETCYSCERNHSWRTLTDTEEHYYILSVLMDYQSGHDAKRAYKALRKRGVDLLATDGYIPSVQKLMAEIYGANHKNAAAKLAALAEEPNEADVSPADPDDKRENK